MGQEIKGLLGCKANLNEEEKEEIEPSQSALIFLPLSLVVHQQQPNCRIVPVDGYHGFLGLQVYIFSAYFILTFLSRQGEISEQGRC